MPEQKHSQAMDTRTHNQISIEKYRSKAAQYDASARRTMPLRHRAIAALQLQPGQTVLDVGAGTGLSYELLLQALGPGGRLLAFEQSPEMFTLARQRVREHGWPNVWHTLASAETVQLPQMADAVLMNYVHDICRTPEALDNIFGQVRLGARVVVAGMKFFPWWTGPLNLWVWAKNQPYNANAVELWQPWSHVAARCEGFQWETTQWGMGYIAWGRLKAPGAAR
jgi:arsenite methyltransferase